MVPHVLPVQLGNSALLAVPLWIVSLDTSLPEVFLHVHSALPAKSQLVVQSPLMPLLVSGQLTAKLLNSTVLLVSTAVPVLKLLV